MQIDTQHYERPERDCQEGRQQRGKAGDRQVQIGVRYEHSSSQVRETKKLREHLKFFPSTLRGSNSELAHLEYTKNH